MNGILKEIGNAMIELQEKGETTIKGTEEVYVDEVVHYVEETLNGLKAAYKKDEIENGVVKVTLQ